MAKLNSIPEKYHQKVMNWTAEGLSAASIQEKLKIECSIEASQSSVYRLINKFRKERREITKAKYAAEIEKTACEDIKIMSEVIYKLHNQWKTSDNLSDSLDILGELRMWIRDKTNLNGIDSEDKDHQAAKDELIEQFNNLKSN